MATRGGHRGRSRPEVRRRRSSPPRRTIDPRRVYAMGHSNGGGFTYVLWAARGDRFAAYGPSSSGALPARARPPQARLRLRDGGRGRDRLVPIANQRQGDRRLWPKLDGVDLAKRRRSRATSPRRRDRTGSSSTRTSARRATPIRTTPWWRRSRCSSATGSLRRWRGSRMRKLARILPTVAKASPPATNASRLGFETRPGFGLGTALPIAVATLVDLGVDPVEVPGLHAFGDHLVAQRPQLIH